VHVDFLDFQGFKHPGNIPVETKQQLVQPPVLQLLLFLFLLPLLWTPSYV
jgi:hypothetical protein